MVTGRRDDSAQPVVDSRVVRTRNDVLRAAIRVLLDDGWDAVTHQNVARAAGYAKATVYAHWPTRTDLVRDAFTRFGDTAHHQPTGDLRADLTAELLNYRDAMVHQQLDRALAVLSDLTHSVPELVPVRDRLVSDGERVMRTMLEPSLSGTALEATTLMVLGAMLQSALLHGRPPSDDLIASVVDQAMRGLVPEPRPLNNGTSVHSG